MPSDEGQTLYRGVIGFDGSWEWGNPRGFGGVVKDDVEIFFCLHDQGHPGTWVAIVVHDLDAYCARIKDKGIVTQHVNRGWNMREMLIEDPDGYIIRLGHRIECD